MSGLYVPVGGGDFKWQIGNWGTTRPGTTLGTLITANATANAMGTAWTQLFTGAQVVNDVYGVMICFNGSVSISAATRNMLFDFGVDNTGGTNYSTLIPYLMGGHASPYNVGSGGIWYYFPLYIAKGSSIATRAQASTASSQTYVAMTLYGQPRRPDTVRVGSSVISFGESTATSRGTAITMGTTAKGAYTQMGTAVPRPLWWWQVGYATNDTTMSAQGIHLDVAAGTTTTNNKLLIQDTLITTTAAEQINNLPITSGCLGNVATGSLIYGRGQSSATADTTPNLIIYGLG